MHRDKRRAHYWFILLEYFIEIQLTAMSSKIRIVPC